MNKMLLLLLAMIMQLNTSAQKAVKFTPAQPVHFQNPMMPLVILEHFARKFPEATPYWGIEGPNYSLKFNDPGSGLARAIIYDREGRIIRYEAEVSLSECPPPLQQFCHRNYANESLRIWCYGQDDSKRYYFRKGSRMLLFDHTGQLLQKAPN
jgi:hypothetical protein